ncbi:SpoIIE family protein phosphatase [uncultured Anaerovibrio sp.]|uniref:SpoIIE family protein phosphatase n=1 Tax=uncultured Anaerovibrio sp. TaxID=361586 RepID=UPI002611246F|nr:SpoIIE family protein phosphatase [uncultured Anaerovibrio sp.]
MIINKFNIQWRFFLLLFMAGLLSFVILGSFSLWGLHNAQQEAMDNGLEMGEAAGQSMEQITGELAQKRLLSQAQEKANYVDREMFTIKEDTEYVAAMMERILAHPEYRKPIQVKDPQGQVINSGEVYLYYSPSIRSPEDMNNLAHEVNTVSTITDTLENMVGFYRNYQGSFLVASKNGYMFCADVLMDGVKQVTFPKDYFTTYDPSERSWYKFGEEAGRATVTEMYYDTNGYPAVGYVVPYRNNGEFYGIVAFNFSLSSLYQAIKNKGMNTEGINFVLTNEGKVVLSSETTGALTASLENNDLRQSSEPTLAAQAEKMVAGEKGMSTVTVDGTEYYLAYAPIPSIGWSVGNLMKASEVVAPAQASRGVVLAQAETFALAMGSFFQENLGRMAASLLVILIVLPLVSKLVARKFVQPIVRLTDGVGEIAKGNLDKQLDIQTGDELQELAASINHMTGELKKYMANLAQVTADKEHIATELSLGQGIQAGMLPKLFPKYTENSGIELYATMEAAKSVGGDFYDFYPLDKDHIAVTMADVAGKGIPAALFMVISKTILKNNALALINANPVEEIDWSEVLRLTNQQLVENNDELMFVTVFFGVLNTRTGAFSYVNGGHKTPLVGRSVDGHMHWSPIPVDRKSYVVGIFDKALYRVKKTYLKAGDILFFYTDGVTGAINNDGEFYSINRLLSSLEHIGGDGVSVKDLLKTLTADIFQFTDGEVQYDDISMLGVRFHTPGQLEATEDNFQ